MADIQRYCLYSTEDGGEMRKDNEMYPEGAGIVSYIKYDDHLVALSAKDQENKDLRTLQAAAELDAKTAWQRYENANASRLVTEKQLETANIEKQDLRERLAENALDFKTAEEFCKSASAGRLLVEELLKSADLTIAMLRKNLGDMAERLAGAELDAAISDLVAERKRQVEVEGWTPLLDDRHIDCELAAAAACYAIGSDRINYTGAQIWPGRWVFKSADYRRMLIKSGALIIAEIERIDRQNERQQPALQQLSDEGQARGEYK